MTDRLLASLRMLLLSFCGSLTIPAQAATPARTPPPAPVPSFAIAPAPAWTRPYTPDAAPAAEADDNGVAYLLLDEQANVEPRAFYYHEAHRITSENGVQNGAAISASFDPSYEKLTFHFIRIVRAGQTLDRLNRSQIKLLQREHEMESFLYDGTFTAQCQLEDVRVGDVIDYAYTVEGANSVFKGHYYDTYATEWSTPVQHAVARIIYPSRREIHFLSTNRPIQPTISTRQGTTEWLWDEKNIPARHLDPDTPPGYHVFGKVQISEFANWQDVVDWAVPLYQVDTPISPDLEQEIARIHALPGTEERILAALRFVQEEIRYLGIESGISSHKPTAPSEVLRRRFGDCKDKTLLLATILQHCGFSATPALVSTSHLSHVVDRLPSPGGFDHVILNVDDGKATWWLDATRSSQRGPLSQVYVSNFGYALVLRPGTRELTPCAPPSAALPKKTIVETYRIAPPEGDTQFEIVSVYRGLSAETMRAYFHTTTREHIEKNYLEYYAHRFSRIRRAKPVEYEELPGENACRIHEQYLIPGIWELSDDKTHHHLSIYPTDVNSEMGTPGESQRNDPLALNYPVDITQEIHAAMFEDWSFKPQERDIANAFFHFHHKSRITGRDIQMTYSYQSLADQVPAADVAVYDATLRKLEDTLGYNFTYSTPQQLAAQRKSDLNSGNEQFNWPIALLLGTIVAGAILFTAYFYKTSKLPIPLPPSLTHRALEGIGGWLVLVMLGIVVRPFIFLRAEFRLYPTIFHLSTWHRLTLVGQPAYHALWMPSLLFELIYNALACIFSVLVIFLFFKKRAAWPRCFAALLATMVVGLVVDFILVRQIPAAAASIGSSIQGLAQVVVGAAIWIPYALTSERVKATFRY